MTMERGGLHWVWLCCHDERLKAYLRFTTDHYS
jgi:hypothetical protein